MRPITHLMNKLSISQVINGNSLLSRIHFIRISNSIRIAAAIDRGGCSVWLNVPALTPRAVVHHLVRKNITVDAEMVMAHCALVSTAHTNPFDCVVTNFPLGGMRDWRKFMSTGKAARTLGGFLPRYLSPIHEWEEMVVGTGQMRGENKGQSAGWALCGECAHFASTAGAKIPPSGRF